jgi:hypothetical protein
MTITADPVRRTPIPRRRAEKILRGPAEIPAPEIVSAGQRRQEIPQTVRVAELAAHLYDGETPRGA